MLNKFLDVKVLQGLKKSSCYIWHHILCELFAKEELTSCVYILLQLIYGHILLELDSTNHLGHNWLHSYNDLELSKYP